MSLDNSYVTKILPLILIGAFLISGCASLGNTNSVTPYNPTFQNSMSEQSNTGESDITIALLEPSYAFTGAYAAKPRSQITSTDIYKYMLAESNFGPQFQEAMVSDFQETVNKKGFLLKGPFIDYDRMVYSDRKDSDLLLGTTLNIYPVVTDLNWKGTFNPLAPDAVKIGESTASLGGQVTLTVYEPMTKTKLWTRSIPIPDNTFNFTGTQTYAKKLPFVPMSEEIEFRNGMAKALENAYSDIFSAVERYLDPREMQNLKDQAQEIREKSGFDATQ